MEPAWHAASDALAAAGSTVKLAKIDASDPTNQSVGGLYGVRGYPTMKTFKDGAPSVFSLIFCDHSRLFRECRRLLRPP
jgi:hypothetical protein